MLLLLDALLREVLWLWKVKVAAFVAPSCIFSMVASSVSRSSVELIASINTPYPLLGTVKGVTERGGHTHTHTHTHTN